MVSRDNGRRTDLVVCFIPSVAREGPDMATIAPTSGTGLRVLSTVRFDKLATLDFAVVAGELGDAPATWLESRATTFFGVFGFTQR